MMRPSELQRVAIENGDRLALADQLARTEVGTNKSVRSTQSTHSLLHSSKSVEWYTPARYIDAARLVMGGVDLDPASCQAANQTVKAARYFSSADDGLALPWHGRIWLNPPYGKVQGKSGQELWARKLLAEHEAGHIDQAVLLVNAATDTRWFAPLWNYPICFTDHRIRFVSPTNGKAKQPTHGSVFVYFGPNVARFSEIFAQFGVISTRFNANEGRKIGSATRSDNAYYLPNRAFTV